MNKFRLYYDKDKETAWLQEMANQGWAMEKFFLGVYTFAPCEPGSYTYQIDLLKSAADYENYRQFMEESGVTVLCRWVRWVFLRKKTEDGAFRLYTDAESLAQHYRAIRRFFWFATTVELICTVVELIALMESGNPSFLLLTLLPAVIAMAMLRIVWKCGWKIEELEKSEK